MFLCTRASRVAAARVRVIGGKRQEADDRARTELEKLTRAIEPDPGEGELLGQESEPRRFFGGEDVLVRPVAGICHALPGLEPERLQEIADVGIRTLEQRLR